MGHRICCVSKKVPGAAGQGSTLKPKPRSPHPLSPTRHLVHGRSFCWITGQREQHRSLTAHSPTSTLSPDPPLSPSTSLACSQVVPPWAVPPSGPGQRLGTSPSPAREGRSASRGGGPGHRPGGAAAPYRDARLRPGGTLGSRAAGGQGRRSGGRGAPCSRRPRPAPRQPLPAPPAPPPAGPPGTVPAPSVRWAPPLSSAGPRGRTMGQRGKSE